MRLWLFAVLVCMLAACQKEASETRWISIGRSKSLEAMADDTWFLLINRSDRASGVPNKLMWFKKQGSDTAKPMMMSPAEWVILGAGHAMAYPRSELDEFLEGAEAREIDGENVIFRAMLTREDEAYRASAWREKMTLYRP